MSTLNKLLLPDETVAFHTKKSPIIFLTPLIWTILTLIFLSQRTHFVAAANGLPLINSLATLAWLPAVVALFLWINQALIYATSDFIVTNRRVILQEGFFTRHGTQTRLSAIAEIQVTQSLLGRLMDYGSITVNSFGGGGEVFDLISAPYIFQKQVSEKTESATR